jgi:hypothetical protein
VLAIRHYRELSTIALQHPAQHFLIDAIVFGDLKGRKIIGMITQASSKCCYWQPEQAYWRKCKAH